MAMKEVTWKSILNFLIKQYPIRGKKEKEVIRTISKILEENNIYFEIQKFKNTIPNGKSRLYIDGKEIESIPASFVSGKIEEKNLISNIIIKENFNTPSISYNPYCKDFSLATFYFSPSINIRREDVKKVLDAEVIEGYVKIKKERYKTGNILIGNTKNPKILIFSHYDTVLNGVVDNSTSISTLLDIILSKKTRDKILKEVLIVLSGSTELSYDKPYYWCYGYRVFEKENLDVLIKSKKIFVVDCIGFDKCSIIYNNDLVYEAFTLLNFEKIKNKTYLFTSINNKNLYFFYSFYHSYVDNINLIKDSFVEKTKNLIIKNILTSI